MLSEKLTLLYFITTNIVVLFFQKRNQFCRVERAIVHMDLDTFFVSCERPLSIQKLNGIPLIIGGDRGVVSSMLIWGSVFWCQILAAIK